MIEVPAVTERMHWLFVSVEVMQFVRDSDRQKASSRDSMVEWWSRYGGRAWRRVQVVREAVRDTVGDGLHRARRKVGVAGGRLELGVAEELGDHGQALAERERPGRERVTQVMEADTHEEGTAPGRLAGSLRTATGPPSDRSPRLRVTTRRRGAARGGPRTPGRRGRERRRASSREPALR